MKTTGAPYERKEVVWWLRLGHWIKEVSAGHCDAEEWPRSSDNFSISEKPPQMAHACCKRWPMENYSVWTTRVISPADKPLGSMVGYYCLISFNILSHRLLISSKPRVRWTYSFANLLQNAFFTHKTAESFIFIFFLNFSPIGQKDLFRQKCSSG